MNANEMYLAAFVRNAEESMEYGFHLVDVDWNCVKNLGELIDEIDDLALNPLMERLETLSGFIDDEDLIDELYEAYWSASKAIAEAVVNRLDDILDNIDDDAMDWGAYFKKYNCTASDACEEYAEWIEEFFSDYYGRLVEMARLDINICYEDQFVQRIESITGRHIDRTMEVFLKEIAA